MTVNQHNERVNKGLTLQQTPQTSASYILYSYQARSLQYQTTYIMSLLEQIHRFITFAQFRRFLTPDVTNKTALPNRRSPPLTLEANGPKRHDLPLVALESPTVLTVWRPHAVKQEALDFLVEWV